MHRRTVLVGLAGTGMTGLAGCAGGNPTETASPTPTRTPSCPGRLAYDQEGQVNFEVGVETPDGQTYDGTMRVIHTRRPPCRFQSPPCETPEPTQSVVSEDTYQVTGDRKYGIVHAPLTVGIDEYLVEFEGAGQTDRVQGLEDGARPTVAPERDEYDFFFCIDGAIRFLLRIVDGQPTIIRASAPT